MFGSKNSNTLSSVLTVGNLVILNGKFSVSSFVKRDSSHAFSRSSSFEFISALELSLFALVVGSMKGVCSSPLIILARGEVGFLARWTV